MACSILIAPICRNSLWNDPWCIYIKPHKAKSLLQRTSSEKCSVQTTRISTILLIKINFFGPKSPCYIFTVSTTYYGAFFSPEHAFFKENYCQSNSIAKCNLIYTVEVNGVSLQFDPMAQFKEKRGENPGIGLWAAETFHRFPQDWFSRLIGLLYTEDSQRSWLFISAKFSS